MKMNTRQRIMAFSKMIVKDKLPMTLETNDGQKAIIAWVNETVANCKYVGVVFENEIWWSERWHSDGRVCRNNINPRDLMIPVSDIEISDTVLEKAIKTWDTMDGLFERNTVFRSAIASALKQFVIESIEKDQ